jgi:hypothetical protein
MQKNLKHMSDNEKDQQEKVSIIEHRQQMQQSYEKKASGEVEMVKSKMNCKIKLTLMII